MMLKTYHHNKIFFFSQSSAMSPHGSMGIQAPGFSVMSSASLQQPSNAMTQQLGQQPSAAGNCLG